MVALDELRRRHDRIDRFLLGGVVTEVRRPTRGRVDVLDVASLRRLAEG